MISNGHKRAAQLVKAHALADVLFGAAITAEVVLQLTAAEWQQVANLANVNPPHSDETVWMVIDAIQAREEAQAKWAGRDPLERITT